MCYKEEHAKEQLPKAQVGCAGQVGQMEVAVVEVVHCDVGHFLLVLVATLVVVAH